MRKIIFHSLLKPSITGINVRRASFAAWWTPEVLSSLKRIAKDMNSKNLKYCIIGGNALSVHGYSRATSDIDVLIDEKSFANFVTEFHGKGYMPRFPGARKSMVETIKNIPIDFITTGEYPGDGKPKSVVFPEPDKVSFEVDVEGVKVPFVNLKTLINLKLASALSSKSRNRDRDDVKGLVKYGNIRAELANELDKSVQGEYLKIVDEVEQEIKEQPLR